MGDGIASLDIHQIYLECLKDPRLCSAPHLAAVSALTEAISRQPLRTISETLALLSTLSEELKNQLAVPAAVSCGTDIFRRQLSTAFARVGTLNEALRPIAASASQRDAPYAGFEATKATVAEAGERFVRQGLEARSRTASYGKRFILDGTTVFIVGQSSLVDDFIRQALNADIDFRVFFVPTHRHSQDDDTARTSLRDALTRAAIPVKDIALESLALHMSKPMPSPGRSNELDATNFSLSNSMVLTGVNSVFADGSILASTGTHTAADVAKASGREFWAISETKAILSWFPSRKYSASMRSLDRPAEGKSGSSRDTRSDSEQTLDATPATLITGIITENGPQNTSAIGEEAIRIWF